MAGSVCIGCGLDVTDDGQLFVATSGTWEDLGLTCDQSNGQIIYCDNDEQLRTAPEKFTVQDSATDNNNQNIVPENAFEVVTTASAVITNPSPCRTMIVQIFPWVEVDLEYRENGVITVQREFRDRLNPALNPFSDWAQDENGLYSPLRYNLRNADGPNEELQVEEGNDSVHYSRVRPPVVIPPGATYRAEVRARVRASGQGQQANQSSRITGARSSIVLVGTNP